MALFTDGSISDVQDLIAYEANLVEVSDAEGIDLESKLRLAQSEIQVELGAAGLRPGNIYWITPGWNSTGAEINLSRFELNKVVVTPPMKLWHTFQTLAIVYRDAYNRKLNDKYLPKWSEYKELARWASNLLYQSGIGLVTQAAPRPAQPVVDGVSGTLLGATYYVRMTWVTGTIEGAASLQAALTLADNQVLRVTPPAAPASPYAITGWNVYIGTASGSESLQNAQPLALGQAWVLPGTGVITGKAVGMGQDPDFYRTVPRFVQRG
jgi:hypothetical protein